jgi:inorganic triphosphatase YgiF
MDSSGNRELDDIKNDIRVLNKIVRDGNGQPSLIAEVSSIKHKLESVTTHVLKKVEDVEDLLKRQDNKKQISWQFKTAIFVALISSFTSIYINYTEQKPKNDNTHLEEKMDRVIELLSQKEYPLP